MHAPLYSSDQIRSDQVSRSVVSDSLRPHESQLARPPCPSPTPGVHSDSCQSSQWCHPAISSSLSSSSPPAPNPSQHQSLFQWVNSSHEVAKVLEFQLQHQWMMMNQLHSSNEYSGLISFRMYCLDLLDVQGTLKSLLQHSIIIHLIYFLPLLMHPFSYKISYIFDSSFDKAYAIHTICHLFF